MEEDQDSDYVGRSPVLSSDEEDESDNGFSDHSLHGSGDGDEIRSPFHSSDEQMESEGSHYSVRSDYSDEGHRAEGVRSSSKRRKIPGVDRISDLPDSVIHRILSFLQAEDAIKTGVLSKRWMYLWTFAPKLAFRNDPDHPRFHLRRFVRSVDKTLFFYSSSKMEKFELDLDCVFTGMRRNDLESLFQKWLRFVTIRHVEVLSLKFCGTDDQYPIPQFVFNSSSLTKLSTSEWSYAPQGQVCWTSLRVLTIERAKLSNDGLQKTLAGCPMLEYLEVNACTSITRVDASSNSRLEKLVLNEMYNHEGVKQIEILCPNLKSVELSGYWFRKTCRLLNVSSLIDVCLTFELEDYQFDYIDMLKELLEKIKHAKKITLSTWCVQVLSLLEFRGLPSPLSGSSCKCLTLNTNLKEWYPFGLAHLLHCFPTLQKLVIDMTNHFDFKVKKFPDKVFPKNYLEKVERVKRTSSCLLEHLETIEIIDFILYQNEPYDLQMVSFLLGNASVLKEMVIHSQYSSERFDLTQKLLSFPRCSPHAVVRSSY